MPNIPIKQIAVQNPGRIPQFTAIVPYAKTMIKIMATKATPITTQQCRTAEAACGKVLLRLLWPRSEAGQVQALLNCLTAFVTCCGFMPSDCIVCWVSGDDKKLLNCCSFCWRTADVADTSSGSAPGRQRGLLRHHGLRSTYHESQQQCSGGLNLRLKPVHLRLRITGISGGRRT